MEIWRKDINQSIYLHPSINQSIHWINPSNKQTWITHSPSPPFVVVRTGMPGVDSGFDWVVDSSSSCCLFCCFIAENIHTKQKLGCNSDWGDSYNITNDNHHLRRWSPFSWVFVLVFVLLLILVLLLLLFSFSVPIRSCRDAARAAASCSSSDWSTNGWWKPTIMRDKN